MRNYLLASAAALGLMVAGGAQAANFAPTDAFQNAGSAGAPKTNPDPGKIVVRVAGLFAADLGFVNSTSDKSTAVPGAKQSPIGMGGYFRLYFGVDGRTTNGIIYGANAEMRTDFAGAGARNYTQGTAPVGNPSSNSTAQLWYTRRSYGYVGGDSWGIVRIGQGDGPVDLFVGNSTGEFYDTGFWDGDICDLVGNGCLNWPFPVTGNEYDSAKIAWVSPSFSGFKLGLSWAPGTGTAQATGGNTAAAGQDIRTSTSANTNDLNRTMNMVEIAARYQGNMGAVGIDAMAGYTFSGMVKPTAGAVFPAGTNGVNNLSLIDVGATLSVAGFQPFFHVLTGKANASGNAMVPQQKLISGRHKDELVWTTGVAYGQGPWIVGVGYVSEISQGSAAGTGNLTETGFNLGGVYTVTPGFDVFAEIIQGTRKQAGVNFRDGGAGLATADNKINTTALLLTGLWRW